MTSERGRLARIGTFSVRDIRNFACVVGTDFAKVRAGRPRSDVTRSQSLYRLHRLSLRSRISSWR